MLCDIPTCKLVGTEIHVGNKGAEVGAIGIKHPECFFGPACGGYGKTRIFQGTL
jgi:hypothetical protein